MEREAGDARRYEDRPPTASCVDVCVRGADASYSPAVIDAAFLHSRTVVVLESHVTRAFG